MKVELLPSLLGGGAAHQQYLTTFVINDRIAIDAGALGLIDLERQLKIEHIFISHSHIDHIASLPIFLENVYTEDASCVSIHASESVVKCLSEDLFNDRVWPDFIRLSKQHPPFMEIRPLAAEQTFETGDLRITAVAVHHVVPTLGYIVEDSDSAIVIASDTAPTERLWELANRLPTLKAVFLECSFPNSFEWLAEEAQHMTPKRFATQAARLEREVPMYAIHIKPRSHREIVGELSALNIAGLEIGEAGRAYEF